MQVRWHLPRAIVPWSKHLRGRCVVHERECDVVTSTVLHRWPPPPPPRVWRVPLGSTALVSATHSCPCLGSLASNTCWYCIQDMLWTASRKYRSGRHIHTSSHPITPTLAAALTQFLVPVNCGTGSTCSKSGQYRQLVRARWSLGITGGVAGAPSFPCASAKGGAHTAPSTSILAIAWGPRSVMAVASSKGLGSHHSSWAPFYARLPHGSPA